MKQIGIVGAGTMGLGITQVCLQAGFSVTLYDLTPEIVGKSKSNLSQTLNTLVGKGKLTVDKAASMLASLRTTTSLADLAASDCVIEAATEKLELKKELFKALSAVVSETCILATNTSSISISLIASVCPHRERVIGLHFFNPAPVMKLVEIVMGLDTSEETYNAMKAFSETLGKTSVRCKDTAGFIVNRIARNFYGEAFRIVAEGTATVAEVDAVMRHAGFKMGPFELMDLIGIDVNFDVTQSVYAATFGEPRFRPHPVQALMVAGGRLGKKAGRGFYDYTTPEALHVLNETLLNETQTFMEHLTSETMFFRNKRSVFARIISMVVNEAAFALQENIASEADIDLAMQLGTAYPKGILAWGRGLKFERIHFVLNLLSKEFGDDRYKASPLLRKC
jgi:3-hydroxybutyryl-CoA dehydrogenase